MSSFTPNIGLENPAYLSQDNTWGTTENTARTMLDQAIAGRAVWTLSSTSFTITVPAGTISSPSAISRVWVFTGTPGGTCTVTFAPNTAQNWVFVINNSSNSIIFTQGSGSTVTILSSAANIVIFDGGGATANVTLYATAPTAAPGTVTSPSYTFTGYSDIGLYVPGPHTLGIAANGLELASFAAAGAGPSGINTLGVTLANPVGNAFSNVDMFAGGWAGGTVPSGYCFLYIDESTSLIHIKYRDSGGAQQDSIVGSYTPKNVAVYAGAAPPVVNNSDLYYEVNEGKTELDFYYKDSSGTSHGPFALGGYGPNNLSVYAGAAPQTQPNSGMWFQVNEAKTELDFYYKNSTGTSFGPFPVASYGPGNIATYAGAAPATINNRNNYFVTDEGTSNLNWYYKDSSGASHGPIPIGNYSATAGWTTYTPTLSSTSGWSVTGTVPTGGSQGSYIQTGKTVTIQILIKVLNSSTGAGTATISLPVSTYTSGFAQTLFVTNDNPTYTILYHVVAFGTSLTVDYTAPPGAGNLFISITGTYQTN